MRRHRYCPFMLGIILLLAMPAWPVAAEEESNRYFEFDVPYAGDTFRFPLYANYDPFAANEDIEHLVYSVHGIATCGQGSLQVDALRSAKRLAGGHEDDTLIIGPHFVQMSCTSENEKIFWDGYWRWKDGFDASAYRADGSRVTLLGVGAYDLDDRIISHVAESGLFPNLRTVVVMGFSAGGQHLSRYSAGTQLEARFPGLLFRYIVVSPSTYMYLNEYRRDFANDRWIVPDEAAYPRYNSYKHGLDDLNEYMARSGRSRILASYPLREVIYAIGDRDTGTGMLESDYKAMLQGENRLERAVTYYRHIEDFFPVNRHGLVVVPGAYHSSYSMYLSPDLYPRIFEVEGPADLNGHVTFDPDPQSYRYAADTGSCPAGTVGTFSFEAQLKNVMNHALSGLGITIRELSHGNALMGAHGPAYEGDTVPVSRGWRNVILNADISLSGAPFFENGWGGGKIVPPETLVDGMFLGRGRQWDQGPVWWDARDGRERYIEIHLDQQMEIDGFIVEADDNDSYDLWYRATSSGAWQPLWIVPNYDHLQGGGLVTRPDPEDTGMPYWLEEPVRASGLRIGGLPGSDGYFAISEIQAVAGGQNDYSDGILSPNEAVEIPMNVCLTARQPFRLVVDVVGRTVD